jgi:hypothetical protein
MEKKEGISRGLKENSRGGEEGGEEGNKKEGMNGKKHGAGKRTEEEGKGKGDG